MKQRLLTNQRPESVLSNSPSARITNIGAEFFSCICFYLLFKDTTKKVLSGHIFSFVSNMKWLILYAKSHSVSRIQLGCFVIMSLPLAPR